MGKKINTDSVKEVLYVSKERITNNLSNQITSFIRKNYIPRADYEKRLKADMVAMLTEIQLEIEEMSGLVTEIHGEEWNEINVIHSQDVLSFIQQKINKLKGEESKHV